MRTRLKSFQDIWRGARGCPLGYSRQGVRQQDVLVVALLGSFPSKLHVDTLQWGVVLHDFLWRCPPPLGFRRCEFVGFRGVRPFPSWNAFMLQELRTAISYLQGSTIPLSRRELSCWKHLTLDSYHLVRRKLSIRRMLKPQTSRSSLSWKNKTQHRYYSARTELPILTSTKAQNLRFLRFWKLRTLDPCHREGTELWILTILKATDFQLLNPRSLRFWKPKTFDPYDAESTVFLILATQ